MLRFWRSLRCLMVWVAIAFLSTGCTRYLGIPFNSVPPDQWSDVRAYLKVPAQYPAGRLVVGDAAVLSGGITERTDEDLYLSLYWVRSATGVDHPAEGETVRVSLDNIERLEVKRLAPVPTAALVGLVAFAVVLVPVTILGGGGESNGGDNGDGTNPTFPRRSR